ncbi:MAG: glycoside hydrolase family 3 protein [Ruminococcus sp.]|nr:glycoside hydrolase family 3 protein [Ruminococcus sp.]
MKKLVLPMLILSLLTGCGDSPVELSAVSVPAANFSEPETVPQTSEAETTEAASEAPTEAEETVSPKVAKKLKEMNLQEKICQMFVAVPEAVPGYNSMLYVDDWFNTCYEEYPIGGFIYFDANISYDQQLRDLLGRSQETAMDRGIGVFQSVDEEGGSITRVQKMLWTDPVYDMSHYGKLNDVDKAYEAGRTIGGYLADYGFNVDFAPVADVNINPSNELGNRIFSSDPIVVSDMSAAVVKGLKSQDICTTLKHFPGLGAGDGNTHYDSVHIDRTYEQLTIEEFPAFKGGIEAGTDFVMVGHQVTSASGDDLPGDLSPVVVTDWLRGEMGFDGIIISDSHSMGAITNVYTSDEAAIMAVKAGVDVILMPYDLRTAVDGLKAAVNTGKIPLERINESVTRILEKKEELGLI